MKELNRALNDKLKKLEAKVGFALACAILAKKLPGGFWKTLSIGSLKEIVNAGIADENLCYRICEVLKEKMKAVEEIEKEEELKDFQKMRKSTDYSKLSLAAVLRLLRKYHERYNEKLVARLFEVLEQGITYQQLLAVVQVTVEGNFHTRNFLSADRVKIYKMALSRFRSLKDLYWIHSRAFAGEDDDHGIRFAAWQRIVKIAGDKYSHWKRVLKMMDNFADYRSAVLDSALRCASTWKQLLELHGLVPYKMRSEVVEKMKKVKV